MSDSTARSKLHQVEPAVQLRKAKPCIPDDDIEALLGDFATILRGGMLTQGEFTRRFETSFAAYVGSRHAVAMSSGTAPLEIALRFWGVEGREVILPTNTFVATANAVILAGGTPILSDINADTLSNGLTQVESLVSESTRGVIVVHVAGLIDPGIAALTSFCRDRGLFVLEDAAHAHGARIDGKMAGSIGDAAAFSFYPTKVMTCGEGGMMTTDDDDLASFARSFRSHGQRDGSGDLIRLGSNYRLPEMSAAFGLRQLARLEEFVEERNRIASWYEVGLQDSPELSLCPVPKGQRHAYYKLPVRLPAGIDRDELLSSTLSDQVPLGSCYWPPCHLTPFYEKNRHRWRGGTFAVAEDILPRTVTLPIYPGLTQKEVEIVLRALEQAMSPR